jgi:hypothetical protein
VRSRRGRPASFGTEEDVPVAAPRVRPFPLRFVHVDERGERLTVDLTDSPLPDLARVLVAAMARDAEFDGTARSYGSMAGRASAARRFLAVLADAEMDCSPEALGPEHLDLLESRLDGTMRATSAWATVNLVCGMLRSAASSRLYQPSPELEARLRFNTLRFEYQVQPLDAYAPDVVAALKAAAWRDVLAAKQRRDRGERLLADGDDGDAVLAALVREVHARGDHVTTKDAIRLGLPGAWDRIGAAHRLLHLTTDDVAAWLILLGLVTGIEPEALAELPRGCVPDQPTGRFVVLAYMKRRAHSTPHRVARIADGPITTPGGLLRLAHRLTGHTAAVLESERLWVVYGQCPGPIVVRPNTLSQALERFVHRHQITDADGVLLGGIDRRRLRKSYKRDRYLATSGVLPAFAEGHSMEVAGRHYADLPSLRDLHEHTIEGALGDAVAVARPRVLPTDQLDNLGASPSAAVSDLAPEVVDRVVSGEADVFVAACTGITHSPFAPPGEVCPNPFVGCFTCPNAVFTARRLPAVLRYQRHCEQERQRWPAAEWERRYGAAYKTITEDILPVMTAEEVATATALADREYVPTENLR